jgi:hypothetical protein
MGNLLAFERDNRRLRKLADAMRADMLGLLPAVHAAQLPPDRPQRREAQQPLEGQEGDDQPQRRAPR